MKRRAAYKNENEDFGFAALLKVCAHKKDLCEGTRLHGDILKRGLLDKSPYISSSLVSMYAKCGALSKAQKLHDDLHIRSVVSWNALIAGYMQQGKDQESFDCFERMQREGFSPNGVTFVCILKICGQKGAIDKGRKIHEEIISRGFLEKDIVLGTALVDMYVKCGVLVKAQQVHNELYIRDVVSWSALIAGYAQQGQGHEALNCFDQMHGECHLPNAVTFTCILKACANIGDVDKGKQIHVAIASRSFLEKDIVLGTALVDMYAKCGALAKAKRVHDGLCVRDVVSWSALIAGYAQQGKGREALKCYETMQGEGLSPDAVTFICILKACGSTGSVGKGKKIHDEIVNRCLLEKNVALGTALVDMYAACGMLAKAQEVHSELCVRDVVSWNALIGGYTQQAQGHEALNCFERMQTDGLSPDVVTFTCILKACGSIGAIDKGKQIHDEILSKGLLGKDFVIGTALVDMYAKCGLLAKAQEVHDDLCVRDVVSWSALITGYAQEGHGRKALECFKQMQGEGLCPDLVTFLCVLNACSRSGLLGEAEIYFGNMRADYGITPDLKHHACMVAGLGYTGHFEKAMSVINTMPSRDHLPVWLGLLGACRKWGNVKLGRLAFDHASQLDNGSSGAYVLMANIYASAGMQKDADDIEAMRLEYAVWNKAETSLWVDATGSVHSFSIADKKHPQSNDIYVKVNDIFGKMLQEYDQNKHRMPENISGNDGQSVMLAIACALINTCQGETIHIMNNMVLCNDCHIAMLMISKVEERKIILNDAKCLHVYENGKCLNGGPGW